MGRKARAASRKPKGGKTPNMRSGRKGGEKEDPGSAEDQGRGGV